MSDTSNIDTQGTYYRFVQKDGESWVTLEQPYTQTLSPRELPYTINEERKTVGQAPLQIIFDNTEATDFVVALDEVDENAMPLGTIVFPGTEIRDLLVIFEDNFGCEVRLAA
jgi:hypothetical protein